MQTRINQLTVYLYRYVYRTNIAWWIVSTWIHIRHISKNDGKQIEEKLYPSGRHAIQCDFFTFVSYLCLCIRQQRPLFRSFTIVRVGCQNFEFQFDCIAIASPGYNNNIQFILFLLTIFIAFTVSQTLEGNAHCNHRRANSDFGKLRKAQLSCTQNMERSLERRAIELNITEN